MHHFKIYRRKILSKKLERQENKMLAAESSSKYFGPRKELKIQRALVSVFDKTGLAEFSQALKTAGVEIVATGGTLAALEKAGISPVPLEKVGHFPEMLDGRVKTLQPEIFAGILARKSREDHMSQIASLGIQPFDLVVCNFYAFEAAAEK